VAVRARVLVIDDEEPVRRVLGRMLRDHDVVTAGGGAEALALLDGDRAFDVIFTDIAMPDMTGIELYQHLSVHRPADAKRLVFVTGGAITAHARDFLDTVPNPYLEKPVRGATLQALVSRMLLTTTS